MFVPLWNGRGRLWVGAALIVLLLARGVAVYWPRYDAGTPLVALSPGSTLTVGGIAVTALLATVFVNYTRSDTIKGTDLVLDRPVFSFLTGVLGVLLAAVAVLAGSRVYVAIAGVIEHTDQLALEVPLLVALVGVLSVITVVTMYLAVIVLVASILGYLALARAGVERYGWPAVVAAVTIFGTISLVVPVLGAALEAVVTVAVLGAFGRILLDRACLWLTREPTEPPESLPFSS